MNPPSAEDQLFQVWREGYAVTGQRDGAYKLGEAEASSFEEACGIVLEGDKYFDPVRLSWWACRLFPTDVAARRSHG